MEWTYTDPSASAKDAVRLSIGDTQEKRPLLFDQEIQYYLDNNRGNVSAAALLAVEAIIAKLSQLCDQSVGSVSKSYSQVRDGYYKLRQNLRARASYRGGMPFAGGISRTQVLCENRDADRVRPQFTARMRAPARGGLATYRASGIDTGAVTNDDTGDFDDWGR